MAGHSLSTLAPGQSAYMQHIAVYDCPTCGVVYGLTVEFACRRDEDGRDWWCPNGHRIMFTRSKVERLEERLRVAKSSEEFWRDHAAAERRRAAAARGQLTKMRNRVARGVCPAAGCKQSFESLAGHVHDCHPELLHTLPDDGEAQ